MIAESSDIHTLSASSTEERMGMKVTNLFSMGA
jgi:hypothetical protein